MHNQTAVFALLLICCVVVFSESTIESPLPPNPQKTDHSGTHLNNKQTQLKFFLSEFVYQLQSVMFLKNAPNLYCACLDRVIRAKIQIIDAARARDWFTSHLNQTSGFSLNDFLHHWNSLSCNGTLVDYDMASLEQRFVTSNDKAVKKDVQKNGDSKPISKPIVNQNSAAKHKTESNVKKQAPRVEKKINKPNGSNPAKGKQTIPKQNRILSKNKKQKKSLKKQKNGKKKSKIASLDDLMQSMKKKKFKQANEQELKQLSANYNYIKCLREDKMLTKYYKLLKNLVQKEQVQITNDIGQMYHRGVEMYANNSQTCAMRGTCDIASKRAKFTFPLTKTVKLHWIEWKGVNITSHHFERLKLSIVQLFGRYGITIAITRDKFSPPHPDSALATRSKHCQHVKHCIHIRNVTAMLNRNWQKPYHLYLHIAPLANPMLDGFSYFPKSNRHGMLAIDPFVLLLSIDETVAIVSHEIGHAFGLLHTYRGTSPCDSCFERERSDTVGDFCADTPPDIPFLFGDYMGQLANHRCKVPDLGKLKFGCFGKEKTYHELPQSNIMSNRLPGCKTEFTPCQAQRMKCWISDVWN